MRLVVFDLDGTLINSHVFITQTMTAAFSAEGLVAPTLDAGRSVIGLSLPEALGRLSGIAGPPLDALVARYRAIYHADVGHPDHEPLYPGARDAVLALAGRPDTLLGVATGKAMRGVNRILALHAFDAHFVTHQTPDHNPSKPHPGMLLRAMSETGARPEETIMIGDTTFDIEMAVAAGTRSIGVSWGSHPPEQLLEAGADAIIDDFVELLPAIDRLMGGQHA